MLRIQRFSGSHITPYIPDLARLRIQVFREFPYLYNGNLMYEEKYLQRYLKSNLTVVVIAFDGRDVVGASTGMPMSDEDAPIRRPFELAGYDLSDIFYFGESVLLADYRGQGTGVAFFREREAHAWKHGYKITTFCAVDRPADHPPQTSRLSIPRRVLAAPWLHQEAGATITFQLA